MKNHSGSLFGRFSKGALNNARLPFLGRGSDHDLRNVCGFWGHVKCCFIQPDVSILDQLGHVGTPSHSQKTRAMTHFKVGYPQQGTMHHLRWPVDSVISDTWGSSSKYSSTSFNVSISCSNSIWSVFHPPTSISWNYPFSRLFCVLELAYSHFYSHILSFSPSSQGQPSGQGAVQGTELCGAGKPMPTTRWGY